MRHCDLSVHDGFRPSPRSRTQSRPRFFSQESLPLLPAPCLPLRALMMLHARRPAARYTGGLQ